MRAPPRLVRSVWLAAVAAAGVASAQSFTWVPLGPEGGTVTALAVDPRLPDRLLAGTTGGGGFRTDDGAATWRWTQGPYVNYVPQLVAHPTQANTFYAATDFGLMVTSNAGDSWTELDTGLTIKTLVAVAVDPVTPTTLYVGSNAGLVGAPATVWKTDNGGTTWTGLSLGATNSTVSALAVDPSTPSTVWAGTSCCGGGLFKSTNGGTSWTAMNAGLGTLLIDAVVVDPTASNTVLVATAVGLYRSLDGGASWAAAGGGLPAVRLGALAAGPAAAPNFWAAIGATVYKSTDHGASWTAQGALPGASAVLSLAVDPTRPARAFAGTRGSGVYATADGGTSWSQVNSGFYGTWITALASFPTRPQELWLGTRETGGFRSSDRGASWSPLPLPSPVEKFVADPSAASTLYAIGGGLLQKSTDGGADWAPRTTGLPGLGVHAIALAPSAPNTLYACRCGANVFRSLDGADTFAPAGTQVDGRCPNSLVVSPTDPDVVIVSAGGGWPTDAVLFSSNGGQAWQVALGLPTTVIPGELAVDLPRFYLGGFGGGGGVFVSTDQGFTWTKCPGLSGDVRSLLVDPTTHALYVATFGRVWRSTDQCSTWADLTFDLFNTDVRELALGIAPDVLYVGTFATGAFALRPGDGGPPDAGAADAGDTDAGTSSDAGDTDAGTSSDGGDTDAGTSSDGGDTDAGASADAGGGSGLDGGAELDVVAGSCGCTGSGPLLGAWSLGLLVLARRRRSGGRPGAAPQVAAHRVP